MEGKKYKPIKVLPILGVVFGAVGLILTAVGLILLADHISFNKNNPSADAVVEKIENSSYYSNGEIRHKKDVYVCYEAEGCEYYSLLGYYTTGMRVGDSVKIHYSKEDPQKIKADRYIAEMIIFPIGVLYAGLGAGMLIHSAKKKKRIKYLLENGIRMYATVTQVLTDYHTKVNGAHPVYLLCQITDPVTGTATTYKSESIFCDLAPYVGMPVEVYADQSNPKDAYVDLKSLIENQIGVSDQGLVETKF